ncbi:MAG: hypothetical protein ABR575_04450 [Actinomycetota bacterium]
MTPEGKEPQGETVAREMQEKGPIEAIADDLSAVKEGKDVTAPEVTSADDDKSDPPTA